MYSCYSNYSTLLLFQVKCLDWAKEHLQEAISGNFQDVLWSDESSVMLAVTRKGLNRNRSQVSCSINNKQIRHESTCIVISSCIRAKHPCKVHIWAGISYEGKTDYYFKGKMNATGYINVLENSLP